MVINAKFSELIRSGEGEHMLTQAAGAVDIPHLRVHLKST